MKRLLLGLAVLIPLAWPAGPAPAVEPDEVLDDQVLESRARELSKVIRCVVCQNESIDTSNAGIARDLRILVRERLTAGDSDRQVLDFLVARYGDYVLLKPPLKPTTYLLWFGPAAIFLLGISGVALYYARRRGRVSAAAAPLTPDERRRLARLLAEAPGEDDGPA